MLAYCSCVAGLPCEESNGRVVYLGNIPGWLSAKNESAPMDGELKLLIHLSDGAAREKSAVH